MTKIWSWSYFRAESVCDDSKFRIIRIVAPQTPKKSLWGQKNLKNINYGTPCMYSVLNETWELSNRIYIPCFCNVLYITKYHWRKIFKNKAEETSWTPKQLKNANVHMYRHAYNAMQGVFSKQRKRFLRNSGCFCNFQFFKMLRYVQHACV